MKRIVLGVLLVTGTALCSRAQKGSILIYGTMDVRSDKEANDDKHKAFSFYPGIGYQFSNKWTAGITGGYGREKFNPSTGADIKSDTYKAGGFARYTQTVNSIFYLYGQSDVYYHGKKESDITSDGFGINLVPAIGINVTKYFALNISFGGISYETNKMESASDASQRFYMNVGKEIGIGVSTNIGGKK